ncbi:unnamed protein product, partial [Urochloa humidicola]
HEQKLQARARRSPSAPACRSPTRRSPSRQPRRVALSSPSPALPPARAGARQPSMLPAASPPSPSIRNWRSSQDPDRRRAPCAWSATGSRPSSPSRSIGGCTPPPCARQIPPQTKDEERWPGARAPEGHGRRAALPSASSSPAPPPPPSLRITPPPPPFLCAGGRAGAGASFATGGRAAKLDPSVRRRPSSIRPPWSFYSPPRRGRMVAGSTTTVDAAEGKPRREARPPAPLCGRRARERLKMRL